MISKPIYSTPKTIAGPLVTQPEPIQDSPYATHALPGSTIRKRKRAAQELEDFDAKLDARAPDFASLLSEIYTIVSDTVSTLKAKRGALKTSEMNALATLAKTLPLLQAAEKNHKTKIKHKELAEMSEGELRQLARGLLAGQVVEAVSPLGDRDGVVVPTLNSEAEIENKASELYYMDEE